MKNKDQNLFTEIATLHVKLVAIVIFFVGLSLLWITAGREWAYKWRVLQIVLEELGGLLLVSATVTFIWELVAKRIFLDEILAKTQVARDIRLSGLMKITQRFLDDIDWRTYIERASEIDIFFAYARTWRGAHEGEIKGALRNNSATIRIVLPDPNDKILISELARRFDCMEDDLKSRIEECVVFFENLSKEVQGRGTVDVWFLHECPVFSFYRFDRIGILALYKHEKGRGNVPTFVFEQGGTLYDFMNQEFDAMISDGLATKVDLNRGQDHAA